VSWSCGLARKRAEVWKWVYVSSIKGLNKSTMKSKHVTIGFDYKGVVSTIASSVDN
jgi:hypothetical protein